MEETRRWVSFWIGLIFWWKFSEVYLSRVQSAGWLSAYLGDEIDNPVTEGLFHKPFEESLLTNLYSQFVEGFPPTPGENCGYLTWKPSSWRRFDGRFSQGRNCCYPSEKKILVGTHLRNHITIIGRNILQKPEYIYIYIPSLNLR